MYKGISKKTKILIISMCVFTILAVVGITYAYFSASNVSGNSDDNVITIETARHEQLILRYEENGGAINALIHLPEATKGTTTTEIMKFNIENQSTTTEDIAINWLEINNGFCQYVNAEGVCTNNEEDTYVGDELTYTLYNCTAEEYAIVTKENISTTCDSLGIADTRTPLTGDITYLSSIEKITIPASSLTYYVLAFNVENTTEIQNYQQNRTFSGRIYVDMYSEDRLIIEGVVYDSEGNPLPNVVVELHSDPMTTTTDENGYYRFENVPYGDHQVKVTDLEDTQITKSVSFVKSTNHSISEDIIRSDAKVLNVDITVEEPTLDVKFSPGVTLNVINGTSEEGRLIYLGESISTQITPNEDYVLPNATINCPSGITYMYGDTGIFTVTKATVDGTCQITLPLDEKELTYNCSENGGTCEIPTSNHYITLDVDLTKQGTKEGWTFVGWNTDKDATTALETFRMPRENTTLYAIYRKEAIELVAKWNSNGATLSSTSDLSCELGAVYNNAVQATTCTVTAPTITAPANTPTILGWNTSSSSNQNNSAYNLTSKKLTISAGTTGTTWYAQTKAEATTASATFEKNGATAIGNTTLTCNIAATYNGVAQATTCSVTAPTITREGFTIDGWSATAGATSGTAVGNGITISEGNKYYAITHKDITGTFNKNGSTSYTHGGTTYTDASKTLTLCTIRNTATTCNGTAPTITASTNTPDLIGWSTGADNHIPTYTSGGAMNTLASNVTLYAQTTKELISRTATTAKNVASATGNNTTATCTIGATYNGVAQATTCDITMPANPYTLTGWTFVGWNKETTATTGTAVNGNTNITVNAIWSKNVTITFNKNGGAADTTCTNTLYNGNTSFSCTAPASTTYTGWTFNGYSDSASSTAVGVAAGGTYTTTIAIGSNTKTAYHNWKKPVTITFNKNGGTTDTTCTNTLYNSETSFSCTAPASTTYTGWTFNGYSDSASSTAAGLLAGGTYTTTIAVGSNTKTAYHNWKKTNRATFSVGTGASAVGSSFLECIAYNSGTCNVEAPSITAKTGYTGTKFFNETNNTSSGTSVGGTITLSANTTYYGQALDIVAPTISFSSNSNATYSKTASVIITVSDTGSLIKAGQSIKYRWQTGSTCSTTASDYTLTAPLSNTSTSAQSATATAVASGLTGNHYLCVYSGIQDNALPNNNESITTKTPGTFAMDNTGPEITSITPTVTSNTSIRVDVTGTDIGSGIATYYYSVTTGSTCDGLTYYPSENSNYSFTGLQESTTYRFCVYAKDIIPNTGEKNNITKNTPYQVPFGDTTLTFDSPNSLAYKMLSDEGVTKNTATPTLTKAAVTQEYIDDNILSLNNYVVENGIYQTDDDDGKTYFYRGHVERNYVSFAGFIWRIVRINGDGSIRIVLDGLTSKVKKGDPANTLCTSGCAGSNASYNTPSDYDTGTGSSNAVAEEATAIEYASYDNGNLESAMYDFYETYIYNEANSIDYREYLADSTFCSDTSWGNPKDDGYGTWYFSPYTRLTSGTSSLQCGTNYRYKVANGAGKLTYPIATLSMDEINYAGTNLYPTSNQNYYLYNSVTTNTYWWTMSPSSWNSSGSVYAFLVLSDGILDYGYVDLGFGLRPVVNLKADTLTTTGIGTSGDPYLVG